VIAKAYEPAIDSRSTHPGRHYCLLPALVRAIALAVLAFPSPATAQLGEPRPEVDPLIGRWELRAKWSAEGVSSIVDFLPGGWYSQTLVVKSRLRYDYDGTRLVLIGIDTAGQPLQSSRAVLEVAFVGDTLIATAGPETVRMARLGGNPGSRGIIGRWVSTNDDGKGVIQDFDYDGFVHVAVTLSGEAGRYSISKNRIEWEPRVPVGGKRRTRFTLKGNTLQLASERGGDVDELIRLR
jgi:hypothetical protein